MSNGKQFSAWQGALVFFVSIFSFSTIPFLNKGLFKLEKKMNFFIAKKEINKMINASNKT